MSDIAVTWDVLHARGDWSVSAGDLATASPLESAVLVSLFTDRRAALEFVPQDGKPRGWWGDTYRGEQIGSRLWQFDRAAKSGDSILPLQVGDACREALQWLIDDGVAASVVVQAAWVVPSASATLAVWITITEPNGTTQRFDYRWAWKGLFGP